MRSGDSGGRELTDQAPAAEAAVQPTVLVIDDDTVFLDYVTRLLTARGFRVITTTEAEDAVALYDTQQPDVVLIDYRMPRADGLKVLAALRASDPDAVVILLSGAVDVATTVQAMRAGAEDVLTKSVEVDQLVVTIERSASKAALTRRHRMAIAKSSSLLDFMDDSPVMKRTVRLLEVAARSSAPVLITGETGSGKALAASILHQMSARRDGAFVRVTCAGQSATFLTRELFGYERGAFAGASQDKRGLFEAANGGTLFLDEIGELSTGLQSQLLATLDDKKVRRLGGTREVRVNCRTILSTNTDLSQLVAEGRFRPDLYYRLAVLPIPIPPLRARGRDAIMTLASKIIREYQSEMGRGPTRFSTEALQALAGYSWPGNVRQLRNVIEQVFPFAIDSLAVELHHLPPLDLVKPAEAEPEPSRLSLLDVERRHIARVLSSSGGNRSEAARVLGISRTTLYAKMREYGLDQVGSDEG